jgi:hypothetical protein
LLPAITAGKFASSPKTVKAIDYHPTAGEYETFIQSLSTTSISSTATSDGRGVIVTWPIKQTSSSQNDYGVTYTLERAQVNLRDPSGSNTEDNITDKPSWTKVADVDPANPAYVDGNNVFFVDTRLTAGSSFAHRVIATKTIDNKAATAKPVIRIVTTAPFTSFVDVSVNAEAKQGC